MKRSIALLTVFALAACSGATNNAYGNGTSSATLPSTPMLRHASAAGSGTVLFSLTIPAATRTRRKRAHYVSPNTQSMTVAVNGGAPQAISLAPATDPHCTGATPPIVCTNLSVTAPAGSDTFAFRLYQEPLSGGVEPPNPTLLATYTTPVPIQIVEGQTNNLGNFALDGVPAAIALAPTLFVAPADGALHDFTLGVTVKDASGATIIAPGNYNPPIALTVGNDPNNALALSTSQIAAPSNDGSTSVTVAYDAAKTLTSGSITASAGGATATAFVNPLVYTVSSNTIVVGGSTQTVTASEAHYGGAFTVASNNSAVSAACSPSCTPSSPGATVKIVVTGRHKGSAIVTVADTNGAVAKIPFTAIEAVKFSYTGAPQTFTVPAGVTSIIVKAFGASGGSGSHAHGGLGGETDATLPVRPGDTLQINVGGRGADARRCPGGNGGFNGGANGGRADPFTGCFLLGGGGAGGGGATSIRPANRAVLVLVAGGGGGAAGRGHQGDGGAGGGATGGNGKNTHQCKGGAGGSQTLGGKGGRCLVDEAGRGHSGRSLLGGGGGDGFAGGGAGGGAGYFGGGGSAGTHVLATGGAGGGSSFAALNATNVKMLAGVNSGNGLLTIAW